MKLFQHPDFDQLVIQARQHLDTPGLTDQLIEKDYFVTEVLRIVAMRFPTQAIFKGGTSLSKAWEIIARFSEDVDLFLDPAAFSPTLGKNAIDRELKGLRDDVGRHPALTLIESKTSGGFGRSDHFQYPRRFEGVAAVRDTVQLEAGTASGREPIVTVELESYVARFLRTTGLDLGVDDQSAFPMQVMHFRRTFVEKMFAIHAKVELFKRDGKPITTYARHYYDLYCLLQRPEVPAMLASSEYAETKADYKRVSEASFSRDYFEPDDMSFARSDALFPPASIRAAIAADYRTQCANLCFGAFPEFDAIEQAFENLRALL